MGRRLRELRLRQRLGLKELSSHAGLSPSLLSQIENGKLVPTLPNSLRGRNRETLACATGTSLLLRGALIIRHGGEGRILSAGDSTYFDSSEPHSYRDASEPPAQAVVVAIHCRR
ncbi:MAG: helix-turn-helix domain-containing protein [Bryobacteraceae bacterium]